MVCGSYPICVIIILGTTGADLRAKGGQPMIAVHVKIEIAALVVLDIFILNTYRNQLCCCDE